MTLRPCPRAPSKRGGRRIEFDTNIIPSQEGYSDGQIHYDYCILTNGCIQKSGDLLYAREKKGRSMQHRLYALHRVSDFYCAHCSFPSF